MFKTAISHFSSFVPHLKNVYQRTLAQGFLAAVGRRQMCDSKANGMAQDMKNRLVWVDLEMTGLEVETCHILEMACLVTDSDLNVVAEAPNLIIHQPEETLKTMNKWCVEHHTKSGLVDAVRASKVSIQQAEYEMLAFVRKHTLPKICPLAGNSVHADKKFLEKYMPQFMDHLHYRIVDVSTVKELCRRWYPEELHKAQKKKGAHRALDDIKESIKELEYYRKAIFQ